MYQIVAAWLSAAQKELTVAQIGAAGDSITVAMLHLHGCFDMSFP